MMNLSQWRLLWYITTIYGLTIDIDSVTSLQTIIETTKQTPPPPPPQMRMISRRTVFRNSIVGSASVVVLTHPNNMAMAVPPITKQETDTGMALVRRRLRPNPPKLLRPRINLDFAVLLMRTSYAMVDALDMIAMNQFQRDFFLIRTAEYEPYIQALGPGYITQQGDLTDPSYFDFIALAQYITINRVLTNPDTIFEELQPIRTVSEETATTTTTKMNNLSEVQRFEPIIVRRIIPNDQLVPMFQTKLGTTLLQYLEETYRNTPIAITTMDSIHSNTSSDNVTRPSIDAIQASLTQIVKLFLINGFAWDGRVTVVSSSSSSSANPARGDVTFSLVLDAPASLWGNESLHRQRATLTNDYLLYTAKEFIQQRTGYTVVSSKVQFQNNREMNYLTIR